MEATIDSARPVLATTSAASVADPDRAAPSKRALWIGRVITGLTVAFLLFSAFAKFSTSPETAAAFAQLGLSMDLATSIAILELSCIALYAIPATANFGVLLLTAYLGGAVAMHVRVGHPMLSHTLFPCYLAVFAWIGLSLRRPHLLKALLRNR